MVVGTVEKSESTTVAELAAAKAYMSVALKESQVVSLTVELLVAFSVAKTVEETAL